MTDERAREGNSQENCLAASYLGALWDLKAHEYSSDCNLATLVDVKKSRDSGVLPLYWFSCRRGTLFGRRKGSQPLLCLQEGCTKSSAVLWPRLGGL